MDARHRPRLRGKHLGPLPGQRTVFYLTTAHPTASTLHARLSGLPVTGFAHKPDDVQDLIKMVGGTPLVIKLLEGTQGVGVVLAETQQAAESIIRITPEERSTAVRAARTMGLNVAGVDLLRSDHGPVVMEVNSSPGLKGSETSTCKDIAGTIVQFIEKNAIAGRTRTRGRG